MCVREKVRVLIKKKCVLIKNCVCLFVLIKKNACAYNLSAASAASGLRGVGASIVCVCERVRTCVDKKKCLRL